MHMKIGLLALAFMAAAGAAQAQTAGMPRVTCEQAKQLLEQRSSVNRRQLSCVNEVLIEVLTIDGQTVIAEVAYMSSEDARIRIDQAADEEEYRRSFRSNNCWNDSDRNLRRCWRARLGTSGECRAPGSRRRVDAETCDRWRRTLGQG